MQTAQTIIKNYRRKRVIVCVTVALLTLILTLGIRFISQRNVNQQRIVDFASHTVRSLENVLLSLDNRRPELLGLVGQPCPQAHLTLRKQAAILQTVRSITLIKEGSSTAPVFLAVAPSRFMNYFPNCRQVCQN